MKKNRIEPGVRIILYIGMEQNVYEVLSRTYVDGKPGFSLFNVDNHKTVSISEAMIMDYIVEEDTFGKALRKMILIFTAAYGFSRLISWLIGVDL